MIYKEKLKDIFKVKNVDVVAHCIAKDAGMGAGIAVTFRQRYPEMKNDLLSRNLTYPSVEVYEGKPSRPPVANLITKPVSYRPPTFEDFEKTIEIFRNVIIEKGYKTIAMPMIGAGLDRLNWNTQVKPTLNKYLGDLDIELTVYFIEGNAKFMEEMYGTMR